MDLMFDGRVVYCSAGCKSGHQAEVSARNARFEEFKVRVAAARPEVTFTEFTGGYPWAGTKGYSLSLAPNTAAQGPTRKKARS